MKTSPFIFLAILCFFVLPVCAIEIPVTDLHYVTHYITPTGYTGDQDINILVASDNDILTFDILGGSLSSGSIYDFPTDVTGIYSTKTYTYVTLADGRTYKMKNYLTSKAFADYTMSGDSRDGWLIGDFSTGTSPLKNPIYLDDNGDIFVVSSYNTKIYKIDKDDFTSVTYLSTTEWDTHPISTGSDTRFDICLYKNSILIAVLDLNSDLDIYELQSIDNMVLKYDNIIMGSASAGSYIVPLTNGNFVMGTNVYASPYGLHILEYNGSASIGTIYNDIGYYGVSTDVGNVIVKPNGIVCVAATSQDKVVTFSTISNAGGIYTVDEGTTPAEITYNAKIVNAEYDTYYNQTKVNFKWSLAIDDDFIDTYNSVYSEPIYNRYYWRIELFSPDGIFVNSYIIPTNWKYQSYTLGIFGSGDYINAGNVDFNNIVGNGTYTVKIYELNRITGAKAFLDSDTFIILSQTNPYTSGSVSDTSGESAAYNFLNSPYLVAIIIIGIVGFQFGRGRDGNINGTAMIVLIPLAVGLCCLMGLLPMWILYVMVLCIIAFVAVKMSTGGS